MEKHSGEIVFHESEYYPDEPERRTTTEQETVFQARRYARYYVATELGYETLPWSLDIDRIRAVCTGLESLSVDEAETHFGDLFAQSLSHYRDDPTVETGDIERPVSLPTEMVGGDDAVLYEQDISLDEDGQVETTGGIRVCYYTEPGNRHTHQHGRALECEPDARVELSPVPIVTMPVFLEYLVYTLRCQIRDCYLGMGLEPPADYRLLGPGKYEFTIKYLHFELYPEYFDIDADIPGYEYDFAPGTDALTAAIDSLERTETTTASVYDRVRDALFRR
ncbi:hypothetical protein [Natronobiforma cellulositropha]|uniref:hypothetical protein n=1 Tax=Natronobiforma cellulositropha TaxID=1679076 RepID=UPI0021D5CD33|nr:hypothetical protein [Natronobiforma cellulositropha]